MMMPESPLATPLLPVNLTDELPIGLLLLKISDDDAE